MVSLYAPNGRTVGSPFYAAKLAWFERLARWLDEAADPAAAARARAATSTWRPTDADVWDPRACHGGTHVSPREREAFARLCRWGLVDAYRLHPPRARPLHLVGLSRRPLPQELRDAHRPPAGRRGPWPRARVWAEIDREARKGKPIPSDHAPLADRPRRARAPLRRGLEPRQRTDRRAARGRRLMAERSATGFPIEPPDRAHAREARHRAAPGRGLAVRAEVGRLPRPRVPRRRPVLHPEPRPEASRPLLSRARGLLSRRACPSAAWWTARS